MNSRNWFKLAKSIGLTITAATLILSMSSCGKKIKFLSSSVVPAATGFVKISRDGNDNYLINVHITNLAESKQLQPGRKAYIVWLVADNTITKNIGQIQSSNSFLSKTLRANFKTVSSFMPTRVFLTAEDDVSVQFPTSEVVLTTPEF
ncbi:MAG: hypothetical protein Q8S18_01820 [Bacteroidales bacterium]|nr:hypothetical protein [Bacteroidales bacterium]